MRKPRGVRTARAAAAASSSPLQTGLPTPTRPAGRAPLPERPPRRRGCAVARAQDAGGAWRDWRLCAPPPSEGAAPGCRVGHDLAFAAAAAAADPVRGAGASLEEETKMRGRQKATRQRAGGSITRGDSPPNLD